MEYIPCDCPCHHPDGYGPLRPDTCQACDGTGLVAVGANFSDTVREVEAEAAAEAVPDTFRRRPVDPDTPPCCSTPQLCGGPHEGCDAAPGGEAAPGTVADGCGACTPTRACNNPRAGCYVHVPCTCGVYGPHRPGADCEW